MIEDLVYDVGMGDGADTAYYLAKGRRVVAIDANPLAVERASKDVFPSGFATAFRSGVRSTHPSLLATDCPITR
jgi:predicted RNA methylase